MSRTVDVAGGRLPGWVERYAERHGLLTPSAVGEAVVLSAADGAVAELRGWAGEAPAAGELAGRSPRQVGEDLARWGQAPSPLALVLVRRGGYAVGRAEDGQLTAHHCGTRYVQSRTGKGGWSQQRYARRRGNQADALVEAVTRRAGAVVLAGRPPAGLVVGGDRALVAAALADPALTRLAELPRRELYDLPDPRLSVLQEALRRAGSLRITLNERAGAPAR